MTKQKNGKKIKDAMRARRRMLIIVATLISLALTAFLLMIIISDNDRRTKPHTSTAEPVYTPFASQEELGGAVDILKGSMWRDKYDANYQLRFDELPAKATETNSFTGTSRVFSINASGDELYLVEGQSRYAFHITDGTLFLNLGEPVGVVEYILVPTENE